jgi:branched-subunit amino acid aminotransferase/4-amino-4-deoxychorismate lyase
MSAVEIIRPGETVELDPAEAAFAHGYGLFETMRIKASKLYFWEAHWRRLSASSEALGISLDVDPNFVLSAIRSLVAEEDPDGCLTLKLSVLKEGSSVRLLVYLRPAIARPKDVGLLLDEVSPINERALLAGHKTHNYMENRLLVDRAKAADCYDVLRLNTCGYVTEGAVSNLFWEAGGVLHTPAALTGLLPGVIRAALLEALDIREGLFTRSDFLGAEVIYLTNSSIGIKQVEWVMEKGKKTPFWPEDATLSGRLVSALERASRSLALSL